MATVTVGIDQSFTSTGVYINAGKKAWTGVFGTEKAHEEDQQLSKIYRAKAIANYIIGAIAHWQNNNPFDEFIINIEGIGFSAKGNATRDLAGLQFVIVSELANNDLRNIHIISPTSLKKMATGSGNASKQDMLDAVPDEVKAVLTSRYKKTKGLYDAVDAYWLSTVPPSN